MTLRQPYAISGYPWRRRRQGRSLELEAGFQYVESETVDIGHVAGANAGGKRERGKFRRVGLNDRGARHLRLRERGGRCRCGGQNEVTSGGARCGLSAVGCGLRLRGYVRTSKHATSIHDVALLFAYPPPTVSPVPLPPRNRGTCRWQLSEKSATSSGEPERGQNRQNRFRILQRGMRVMGPSRRFHNSAHVDAAPSQFNLPPSTSVFMF